MEEELKQISIQLNILESLTRILLEAMRNGENLKSFDSNNLALTILNNVINIKGILNNLEEELGV